MTNVVDFRDREVCQFIKVYFAILQVLTFATICCDSVTYNFVNKWNQKRIHASIDTLGPVEHTLLLIFAQDRKCPKNGTVVTNAYKHDHAVTTLCHIRYANIYLRADYVGI
jgi:hypothetical protein